MRPGRRHVPRGEYGRGDGAADSQSFAQGDAHEKPNSGQGTRYVTVVGTTLPLAYVIPIALSEISGYFGRLDVLAWMSDLAMLASVPWEVVATVIVIARWRDLPQRFWILYCVNGFLAYISLPIYRMHFGMYW